MRSKALSILFILYFAFSSYAQAPAQDTIFLLNGHVVGEKVIDTLLGAVTIMHPKKAEKKIHYELNQLYMVKFSNGYKRFYYQQDSAIYNIFTRDEMWLYMKGEQDSRKGFKAKGSIIGAGIAGFLGGATGTFWAPVLPYGYMALTGIPRVYIRSNTVSNPAYIESDAYILGYERVARQRRRIHSIISGSIGMAVGYAVYAIFHNSYPEQINIGFGK